MKIGVENYEMSDIEYKRNNKAGIAPFNICIYIRERI